MSEIQMLLDEIRDLKRRLQALETRQEHPGFAASDVARLSVANTFAGVQTIPNTGLHLLDTNASHDLIIAPGSNLTADRTLTLTTGDADRTVTLSGNPTLADWFDQSVKTTGTPTFAQATVDNLRLDGNVFSSTSGAVTVTPLAGQNLNVSLSTTGDFAVNTNHLYIDTSTGLSGFGTTTPTSKLAVVSADSIISDGIGQLSLEDSTALAANVGAGLVLKGVYKSDGTIASLGAIKTGKLNATTDDLNSYLSFYTRGTSVLTEQVRIDNAGNVGIGTTAPGKALEINSATGANLRLTYNDSNGSATNYADLSMSSGGDLTIAPSGGDTTITGSLSVTGNTTLGDASTDTITHTGRAIFRTAASDPKHVTAGSRPAGSVGEIAYYAGKMYICTNAATPTWEMITSA